MTYPIHDIADIPAPASAQLEELGVTTTEALLLRAASQAQRETLGALIGVNADVVLAWANDAELMRITGTGEGITALLEAAGVESIGDLAASESGPLTARLVEVNSELELTERLPAEGQVAAWIETARALPPIVTG